MIYEDWNKLRDTVYKRDNGICWVCGEYVGLNDYHLGHLVDACRNGSIELTNLAVMHQNCNLSKPRHNTLYEASQWRISYKPRGASPPHNNKTIIAEQKVIDYFNSHPELKVGKTNPARSNAIKILSNELNVSIVYIRQWVVKAGFVNRRIIIKDGSQYFYILHNLKQLNKQYKLVPHNSNKEKISSILGITRYQLDIFLYLSGYTQKVMPKHLHAISKRVEELHIQVKPKLDIFLWLKNLFSKSPFANNVLT